MQRVFWWGASALRRTGGAAQISIWLRNGFGFRRKIAPNKKPRFVLGFLLGIDEVMESDPHAIDNPRQLVATADYNEVIPASRTK